MSLGTCLFCWLLLLLLPQSHRVVLGEPGNVHITFSHLKKWVQYCINHSDEGNYVWLKYGRCASHHCSKAAPQSPFLGRHQAKQFYSLSLLCSKLKTLILFPSPPPLLLEMCSIIPLLFQVECRMPFKRKRKRKAKTRTHLCISHVTSTHLLPYSYKNVEFIYT